MGVLWVSYGCLMGVLWVSYGCLMGVLEVCLMGGLQVCVCVRVIGARWVCGGGVQRRCVGQRLGNQTSCLRGHVLEF